MNRRAHAFASIWEVREQRVGGFDECTSGSSASVSGIHVFIGAISGSRFIRNSRPGSKLLENVFSGPGKRLDLLLRPLLVPLVFRSAHIQHRRGCVGAEESNVATWHV